MRNQAAYYAQIQADRTAIRDIKLKYKARLDGMTAKFESAELAYQHAMKQLEAANLLNVAFDDKCRELESVKDIIRQADTDREGQQGQIQ